MSRVSTVGGYLPASFLDWDGHISDVIFTTGCNFRCPWCHNGALVEGVVEDVPLSDVLANIVRRVKFLDGVCVSGGEPTLWDGLVPFIREVRELGLPVKLDTNGSNPDILLKLFDEKLVSHVAMDVKAPLDTVSYQRVTRSDVPVENMTRSVEIIRANAPSYEYRTTFVPGLMTPDDLTAIRKYLNDDAHWFVQCFKPMGCLDESFLSFAAAEPDELKKLLPGVTVRG